MRLLKRVFKKTILIHFRVMSIRMKDVKNLDLKTR